MNESVTNMLAAVQSRTKNAKRQQQATNDGLIHGSPPAAVRAYTMQLLKVIQPANHKPVRRWSLTH